MAKTPLVENGLVVGTGSDKYESKNPISQYLLRQFDSSIAELVKKAPLSVGFHEMRWIRLHASKLKDQ